MHFEITVVFMALVSCCGVGTAKEPAFEASYASTIRANCLRCHNARHTMGGLDLSTREGLLKGGDTELAIVVHEPNESLLIRRVREGSMPPINDGEQLSPAKVDLLTDWISAGAKWSGGTLVTGGRSESPAILNRTKSFSRARRRWCSPFRSRYRP